MTNDNEIPARPSASPNEVSVELKQFCINSGLINLEARLSHSTYQPLTKNFLDFTLKSLDFPIFPGFQFQNPNTLIGY